MTCDNILVIDIETTGLDGYEKGDKILSIGIATVNIPAHRVMPTFYAPIHQVLTPVGLDCWLFRTKHMDPSEITGAPWGEYMVADLMTSMIDNAVVTTYNTAFDLDLFLDPWLMDNMAIEDVPFYFRAPCLMRACSQVEEIPRMMHEDGTSWPSLKASFYQLCGGQSGIKMHNALNDAVVAGEIMLALIDMGLYDPDREEEYA